MLQERGHSATSEWKKTKQEVEVPERERQRSVHLCTDVDRIKEMERRYDMERDTSLEGNAMKHNIVTRRGNQTEHIISFNLSHIFKFSNDHIISVMSATYVNTIIGTHTHTHTHTQNKLWVE